MALKRFQKVYPRLIFLLLFILPVVAKLWLVDAQTLDAVQGTHDDRLYIDLANNLLNGQWLGDYNNLTLAKGPFYPIWIALIYKTGIPLLLAQHALYIVACLIFIIATRPFLPNRFMAILIFIILIFNPMSYSSNIATRVLREGIYPALTILVFSCALGLLARHKGSLSRLLPWAIGLGLSFSAFWLTREEGIWIIPSIILIFSGISIIQRVNISRLLISVVLPLTIGLALIGGVVVLNKTRYGIATVSELKSRDFLAAYGTLLRVKHPSWHPAIPVSRNVREQIYEASPAFAELRQFLENCWWINVMDEPCKQGAKPDPSKIWDDVCLRVENNDKDLWGGWFVWALRDAVAKAGYYTSGPTATDYYKRLALEVNRACSDGRLDCLSERATLMPPLRSEYFYPFIRIFRHNFFELIKFNEFWFWISPGQSSGDETNSEIFRKLTHEKLSPLPPHIYGWAFSPKPSISLSIMSSDGRLLVPATGFNESPDVYQYFFKKGLDFPRARKARFALEGIKGNCYLLIGHNNQIIKIVLLDGNINSMSTEDLYFNIDSLNLSNPAQLSCKDKIKLNILSFIGNSYKYFMPLLGLLSIAIYIIYTLKHFWDRAFSVIWIINTGLLAAIILRLIILSLIHISSFPVWGLYLAPSYPLMLIFTMLNLYSLISGITNSLKITKGQ
jgi:hypothetical protein